MSSQKLPLSGPCLQHAKERCGRVLQSINDVLAIFDATGAHPLAYIAQEIGFSGCEIEDDEPAQDEAFAQHGKHIRPGHRRRQIVLREEPAYRNACKVVEQRPLCASELGIADCEVVLGLWVPVQPLDLMDGRRQTDSIDK